MARLAQVRTQRNGRPARQPSQPSQTVEQLARDLRAKVRGEVRFDAGTRALYATDASNYRHVPVGVVVPRDSGDVVQALEVCRNHGVPVLPRGGGTSLAGQACNVAVVFDFGKYMCRVLEVDPIDGLARVEPGAVLDDLRRQAERYGLTFGPDPATHDRCTLGGMIGNNSCGVHGVLSEFYGPGPRTEDNVESIELVTYDGVRMRVGETSDEELDRIIREGGRRGQIYASLRTLRDRYAGAIRERFPEIPRRVSGYGLPALLPERRFNLAAALTGTEGTCVTILEATVKLVPHRGARVLLLLGYPSIFEAGDHISAVREHRPVGLEALDDRLVDHVERMNLHADALAFLPAGRGWLMVEFGADSKEEALEQAHAAMKSLARDLHAPTMKLLERSDEQAKLWAVREAALAATAFVSGEPDSWPGWEDSAVPVSQLGAYLRNLDSLLTRYDYRPAVYGHFGQGCVHSRIDFDLTTEVGIAKFRSFTSEAADLVVAHGGSLSGEHGDGQARGDLLSRMYGQELCQAMREFKAIWDPEGKMNPGKVVDARPRDANLRLGTGWPPPRLVTEFSYPEDGDDFAHAALRCVGVGKCRRTSGGTMCPSYMVTREEKHTTRGRAHLLFEMVKGEVIQSGWKSEEVHDSLELCLSCKGCKSDCPVHVDVARYKAEFLHHYYARRRRPRQAYAFGLVNRWARWASLAPPLANFVTHAPGLSAMSKWIAGMARAREIPRFSRTSFRTWFERRNKSRGRPARLAHLRAPRCARTARRVILWVDTFNNYFCPQTLAAAVDVLEHAGCEVTIPEKSLCCGRPLYDYGMLDKGRELFRQALEELGPAVEQGIPVVGVEPSCVASFRDELPALMPGDARAAMLSSRVLTLAELLEEIGYEPPQLERKAYLHGHCHHKAVMKMTNEERVLHKMGIDYEIVEPGCCGMAGAFGFERQKYAVSRAIGERAFLPAIRHAADEVLLIADGFSCREQARQGTGRTPLHLAEVIQLGLHQEVLERTGGRPDLLGRSASEASEGRGGTERPLAAEGRARRASHRLAPLDLVGRPSPAILALLAWISLLLTLAGALVGLL